MKIWALEIPESRMSSKRHSDTLCVNLLRMMLYVPYPIIFYNRQTYSLLYFKNLFQEIELDSFTSVPLSSACR